MIYYLLFISVVITIGALIMALDLCNDKKWLEREIETLEEKSESLEREIEILGDLKLSMQNLKDVCELTEENRKLKNKLKQSKTK
jgi:hypothetical protein